MGNSRLHWQSVIQQGVVLCGVLLVCVPLVVATSGTGLPETATAVVAGPQTAGAGDCEALMAALRGAGGMVRPAGEFSQPFFKTGGRVVEVDGTLVLVFEYLDERDREAESDLIAVDGRSVGSTNIIWTDQPNFWASGRVIVEYLGSDPAMLSRLSNALGTPITLHERVSTD